MKQEKIFDKDYICEQFAKSLEALNDSGYKSIFDEPTEETPEQKLQSYCLNIFAEGYKAGAKTIKSVTTEALDDISIHIGKASKLLLLAYHRYLWKDFNALKTDENFKIDYISAYPDIQTLIDVTLDMTDKADKRIDEAFEILNIKTA